MLEYRLVKHLLSKERVSKLQALLVSRHSVSCAFAELRWLVWPLLPKDTAIGTYSLPWPC